MKVWRVPFFVLASFLLAQSFVAACVAGDSDDDCAGPVLDDGSGMPGPDDGSEAQPLTLGTSGPGDDDDGC